MEKKKKRKKSNLQQFLKPCTNVFLLFSQGALGRERFSTQSATYGVWEGKRERHPSSSQNPRVAWVRKDFKAHLIPVLSAMGGGTLPLSQVVPSPLQHGLGHSQG